MFSAVNSDSTQRLLETKTLIDICGDTSLNLKAAYNEHILLGSAYVLLYGALEYTITHCVYRTIELLNNENLKLYDVHPALWGLIYNGDCMRMEMAGENKKWENRYKLFHQMTKTETVGRIEDALFPSSNGKIKEKQIERVWQTFGLKSPMIEPGQEIVNTRLQELAEGRMAVAHGREKASFRGKQKSITDLVDLYNSISRYCSYIINCFTKYIQDKEYLQ